MACVKGRLLSVFLVLMFTLSPAFSYAAGGPPTEELSIQIPHNEADDVNEADPLLPRNEGEDSDLTSVDRFFKYLAPAFFLLAKGSAEVGATHFTSQSIQAWNSLAQKGTAFRCTSEAPADCSEKLETLRKTLTAVVGDSTGVAVVQAVTSALDLALLSEIVLRKEGKTYLRGAFGYSIFFNLVQNLAFPGRSTVGKIQDSFTAIEKYVEDFTLAEPEGAAGQSVADFKGAYVIALNKNDIAALWSQAIAVSGLLAWVVYGCTPRFITVR